MRDMNQTVEEINITNYERAFTVGKHPKKASHFRMNIPKLMPFLPRAVPSGGSVVTCKGKLVNDSSTKPSMSSTVTTQNYITYPRLPNSDYTNSNENVIPVEIFNIDTRGILLFPECDIRHGFCFEFF